MRIILLGADGQVGSALQNTLTPIGELIVLNRKKGDLSAPAELCKVIRAAAPQVIVNAAAYTAVDEAEKNPDIAKLINGLAPGAIAEEARRLGALLLHYSTDYVFGNDHTNPLNENERPSPINAYGRTKLEGEKAIAAAHDWHLIFRTSWVYSAKGRNFIRTILRLARERSDLRVVDDQWGAPTAADLIAQISALAIQQAGKIDPGIYHLAPHGETNWYSLANHVIAHARKVAPQITWQTRTITPVSSAHYGAPARRPLNSRLDTSKLRSALEIELPQWQLGVERAVEEIIGSETT